MKILALVKYGARAASTRQRLLQYAPFLAENGIEVDVRPLLDDAYLAALMGGRSQSRAAIVRAYGERVRDLLAVRDHDIVWVQYELFPYVPLLDGVLAALSPRPIVYDIDDAIFHMYDARGSGLRRRILGGKLRPLMRRAAMCLCGNAYLRDYVVGAGGRAIVVPTVVDTEHFRPALTAINHPLTIGWIGSPSTWRYVERLLPTLWPELSRLDVRFRVVGAGPAAQGIDGIDAVEWNEASEVADLQRMDVGLMPVPDDSWAQGKCGYKLIQYMACGVPTIATPVGVNSVIVGHGRDGFLASDAGEWVTALETLVGDAALRRTMGQVGRAKVVERYSVQSQRSIVLAALRDAQAGARS